MQANGRSLACLMATLVVVASMSIDATTTAESNLLQLAKAHFADDLTLAEQKMLGAAANGGRADCTTGPQAEDSPANSSNWTKERTIRADRLAWLCTDPMASGQVTYRGISIAGARIDGDLNLEWAKIQFPLVIEKCAFTESIILQRAHLRALELAGTHIKNLFADGLEVETSVMLRGGFNAKGVVWLAGATINGDLDCQGGQFANAGARAFVADRARIEGSVYFRDANAEGEVRFTDATIGRSFECVNGQFMNTNASALTADGARIEGSVFLNGKFKAEGGVRLQDVTINGALACEGGQFLNPNGVALMADGARIKDGVFVRSNITARGEVSFLFATIGGNLDCSGALFVNSNAVALRADGAKIEGLVFLNDGFKAEGEVRMPGATIGQDLACGGGRFYNGSAISLNIGGAKIERGVFLADVKVEGRTRLSRVTIGGDLVCKGGQFDNGNDIALITDGATITGNLVLENVRAAGAVRLVLTIIGGDVSCVGGKFGRSNGTVLSADGSKTKGSFLLLDAMFEGEVRLDGAEIGSELNCSRAQFTRTNGVAFSGNGARIDGNVSFRNSSIKGEVNLIGANIGASLVCSDGAFRANGRALTVDGAKIGRDIAFVNTSIEGCVGLVGTSVGGALVCEGSRFFNAKADALHADNARIVGAVYFRRQFQAQGKVVFAAANIGGAFQWRDIKSPENAVLDMQYAKIEVLLDDHASWPTNGNLLLDGLVYDRLAANAPVDATSRITWIQRQPRDRFLPQPYEQLSAVLRTMGHEDVAKEVMIAKNEDRVQRMPWLRRLPWWFFGKLVGYGYRPDWALYWSTLLIVVSTLVFWFANGRGIISRTDPQPSKDQPKLRPDFSAFIYSLQTFVPLLELDMAQHWRPNTLRNTYLNIGKRKLPIPGFAFLLYLRLHIILGWILTTLWLGAFTGLVKT